MRTIKRTQSSECLSKNRRHHNVRGRLQISFRGSRWATFEVSNELWGAASLALKLCKRRNSTKFATTAASSNAFVPNLSTATAVASEYPQSIADALNYSPKLTPIQEILSFAVSAAICMLGYYFTRPPAFSLLYAAIISALCVAVLGITRGWLLERQFKALQRSEHELSSSDALFTTIDGVELHYKKDCSPSGEPTAALACLHGFGASSYSWSFVQRDLACACDAIVTSHDMCGFGLSQRPAHRHPYSLAFNGSAALTILDEELHNSSNNMNEDNSSRSTTFSTPETNTDDEVNNKDQKMAFSSVKTTRKILVGHSMGGAAAAEAIIRSSKGISGLILVAPAVVAMWNAVPDGARSDAVATGVALAEEFLSTEDLPGEVKVDTTKQNPNSSSGGGDATTIKVDTTNKKKTKPHNRHLGRVALALTQTVLAEFVRLFVVLSSPLIIIFLRRLVRQRSFWQRGLSSAWVNKSKVTSHYIDAYRMGQLVRGWERGIINFLAARFSEKRDLWQAVAATLEGDGHLSQAERLADACASRNVKVLIIHGVEDSLVPVANSRRLAQILPNAAFVEFERCGHMPHEEQPERFVQEVQKFVESLV